MKINIDNKSEFIGQIIDIFEDFLEEKGIRLDNDEREADDEFAAIIYGSDYGDIQDQLEAMLNEWANEDIENSSF